MKVLFLVLLFPICAFGQMDVCKEIADASGNTNRKTLQLAGNEPLARVATLIREEFAAKNNNFPALIIEIPPGTYTGESGILLNQNLTNGKGICLTGKGLPVLHRTSFADKTDDASAVIEIEGISNVVVRGFDIEGTIDRANRAFSPAGFSIRNFNSPEIFNIHIEGNLIHRIGQDYEYASLNGFWRYVSDKGDHSNCTRTKPSKTEMRISCGHAHGITVNSVDGNHRIHTIFVERNKLTELRLGESEAVSINNNVQDFRVLNNEIWDIDNIGIDITGKHDSQFQAKKGVVSGNRIYGLKGALELKGQNWSYPFVAGIYVDGGTGTSWAESITVNDNTVSDFGIGISVGSENDYCDKHAKECTHVLTEFIRIEGNTLSRNRVYGVGIGKDSLDQNSHTWNVKIINNKLFGNNVDPNEEGYSDLHFGSLEADSLKLIEVSNNEITTTEPKTFLVRVVGEFSRPDVTFTTNAFSKITETGLWSWAGSSYAKDRLFDKTTNLSNFPRDSNGTQIIKGEKNRWVQGK